MNYKSYIPKETNKKGQTKKCSKCRKIKPLREFYYHRARKHHMSSCKKCNDKRVTKYYKTNKSNPITVFQLRAGDIYRRCRINKIPCMKKLGKHLADLWKNSQKCFYTKEQMSLTGYFVKSNAVTVDRLVPEKGYIENNIVLCTSKANRIKQNLTCDELFTFCQSILGNKKRIKKFLTSIK